MRVTSARGIIAYEITKVLMREEAHRRPSLDLVKRQMIRECIDGYYRKSFGNSLIELKQCKLEIDILNEELDNLMERDLPNLSESLSRSHSVLTEGAILPTWVNMILPFVGMGVDIVAPGTGAGSVIDIVNSFDMFFGATSSFEYILSGIFIIMAIPAVGDALGVTAAPVLWLGDKVAKAKGMMGTVIKNIISRGQFQAIGKKVLDVIQPLLKTMKPEGTIFKFIAKMWKKLPVNKAGEFATKMKGQGGAAGVLGKMADALQKGLNSVRKMLGLAAHKVSVGFSKMLSGGQVRALKNVGVNSIDDIVKAETSLMNSMGKQVVGKVSAGTKSLEVMTKSGATKTITSDLGMGVRNFVVKKGPDGADEVFAVITRASGMGSAPGKMGLDAGSVLGKMSTGLRRTPVGMIPARNLPKSMINDLGLTRQLDDLATIGKARVDLAAKGAVVPPMPKPPVTPAAPTVAAAPTVVSPATIKSAEKTAAEIAKKRGMSKTKAAFLGAAAGGGGTLGLSTAGQMVTESVTRNRLLSTAAYLDGIIDLPELLG